MQERSSQGHSQWSPLSHSPEPCRQAHRCGTRPCRLPAGAAPQPQCPGPPAQPAAPGLRARPGMLLTHTGSQPRVTHVSTRDNIRPQDHTPCVFPSSCTQGCVLSHTDCTHLPFHTHVHTSCCGVGECTSLDPFWANLGEMETWAEPPPSSSLGQPAPLP